MANLQQMILDIISLGSISAETRLELRSYLADLERNRLEPIDRDYVIALYRRLFGERSQFHHNGPETHRSTTTEPPKQELSAAEWQERAYRAMARAKRAEIQLVELEQRMRASEPLVESDWKFQEAKRQFARTYHPDQVKVDGIERAVRNEIFKEFWSILDRIEKSKSG